MLFFIIEFLHDPEVIRVPSCQVDFIKISTVHLANEIGLKIFAIVLAVSFEKVQDLRIVFFTEPGIFLILFDKFLVLSMLPVLLVSIIGLL